MIHCVEVHLSIATENGTKNFRKKYQYTEFPIIPVVGDNIILFFPLLNTPTIEVIVFKRIINTADNVVVLLCESITDAMVSSRRLDINNVNAVGWTESKK